jgi:hypothetical protein
MSQGPTKRQRTTKHAARRWYETPHGIDKQTRDLAAFERLIDPRNKKHLRKKDHERDTGECWRAKIKNSAVALGGFYKTEKEASERAVTNWLSEIAYDDDNDVWEHEEARRLRQRAKDMRDGHEPPDDHGLSRNHLPGQRLEARADGSIVVRDTREGLSYVISQAALDAVEREHPDQFPMVKLQKARAVAFPDTVHATKKAEAEAEANILIADSLDWHLAEKARVEEQFLKLQDRMYFEKFGLSRQILDDLKVKHVRDLEKKPLACLLGSKKHCPVYGKVMEALRQSEKRAMRQEVDGQKSDFRTIVGEEGVKACFRARFPRLAKYDRIIQAMADNVNYDHIFSAACWARRGNRPVFSTPNDFYRPSSPYPLAGDHPMNMSRRRRRMYLGFHAIDATCCHLVATGGRL